MTNFNECMGKLPSLSSVLSRSGDSPLVNIWREVEVSGSTFLCKMFTQKIRELKICSWPRGKLETQVVQVIF